ncbi:hypothetical protein [Mycolicibacterium agri]|nr:hypothetical protein [Mycolicibacterium agri]
MPGRDAATILMALGVGLGLMRSIDPCSPVHGLVEMLRLLIADPSPEPP